MDTLYTFWDNLTHYETKSVHFWGAYELLPTMKRKVYTFGGLMNSATVVGLRFRV